jgi:hypothetical protein
LISFLGKHRIVVAYAESHGTSILIARQIGCVSLADNPIGADGPANIASEVLEVLSIFHSNTRSGPQVLDLSRSQESPLTVVRKQNLQQGRLIPNLDTLAGRQVRWRRQGS